MLMATPTLDPVKELERLDKEKNAIFLAEIRAGDEDVRMEARAAQQANQKMFNVLRQDFAEQRSDIKALRTYVETAVVARIDKLDDRVGKLESGMQALNGRVGKLDSRVGKLETGMRTLNVRVDKLDERVGRLETNLEQFRTETNARLDLILDRLPPRG
jgi:X-X-X-Leu-X-X-Gly heptad repeat protein